MSLDSQRSEIDRAFGTQTDIEIVESFAESKSAKTPGRPLFDSMLQRIEAGEAQGIMAWAPDRLARNSMDGGRLVYLLDRGLLTDLKFVSYTFENNSQGKFMLNIMFGYSKYYSDNLSDVVKRGNRTKLERGWRPNAAPTGYVNDQRTKTIEVDPERFRLVQRLFAEVAAGATLREATLKARDTWGFTTRKVRKGGGLISLSAVHHILTSPFYMGDLIWNGETYAGSHKPAVSRATFEAVQRQLGRPRAERPKRGAFTYTGLMRCGPCGLGVTAEHKVNRYGSRYIYYRCVRPKLGPKCREPAIEERDLEEQIVAFLQTIHLDEDRAAELFTHLDAEEVRGRNGRELRIAEISTALERLSVQLRELPALRLRGVFTDEEFVTERARVETERQALEKERQAVAEGDYGIGPARAVISISKYAVESFQTGDREKKRAILKIVGSHPILTGKRIIIQAVESFQAVADFAACPSQLGYSDEVSLPCALCATHDSLPGTLIATAVGKLSSKELQTLLELAASMK